jgi:hypothetical protein
MSAFVDVPSGGTVTIRLELAGKVALPPVHGGRRYRLVVWHQPTIEPDQVDVKVTAARDASLSDGQNLEAGDAAFVHSGAPATIQEHGVTISSG